MKKWIIMLMLTVLTLSACSSNNAEEGEEEERVATVEVTEVTKGDLQETRNFYARTMPNQTTPVIPQAAGEVDELEVENGEQVEEDDTLATIQTQRGNIDIDAPSDGVVSQLNAQAGSMVSTQDPLLVILDLDQLTIQLQVPDTQLSFFEEDETMTLSIDGNDHEATIEYIADATNDAGLFPVELSYDNQDTDYKAGITASVSVNETVAEDTLLVPTSAIIEENNEAYVFVTNDSQAKRVDVTIQAQQSETTAIETDDMAEGDQVITDGHLTITDNSDIQVAEEE
ncbi:hypothetical protein J416_10091 [Gracilibacillus halophilus YIM-C55.5]|uniref:Lipoyl-binding domain-containing protein n=1 Tax=Gracilibacillus halophilus YIM-C55.5 TaxID=1308866 RepID=N4WBG8_9BACI|nr:efflux RND transporter periplasmic adaptor subunit [Gracilibacillus halophilus]ENH96574.1 hypothetical protein J416_10091 [Gracilibacillus halophilus YIM-C55.5]